jgi:hypothetical protein
LLRAADSLRKHPQLTFGISGCKALIANWSDFKIRYIRAGRLRSTVKAIDVLDVDVDHRRCVDAQRPWAPKIWSHLSEHDEAVVSEDELMMPATRGANRNPTLNESERFGQKRDRMTCILVEQVRRHGLIASWRPAPRTLCAHPS